MKCNRSGQMKDALTDVDKMVAAYIRHNFKNLMTDLEARSYHLAAKRKMAAASESAADRLPRWIREAGEDATEPSKLGEAVIKKRIDDRIYRDLNDGRLILHRCPRCKRTPTAEQCVWCGLDWYKYVPLSARPGFRESY
jgi:hypothetical protein